MLKKNLSPFLTIIIPCFNEQNTINEIIELIVNVKDIRKEIIVIDDKSTDGTVDILKNIVSKKVKKIIYHDENKGKGAAIRSGLKHATGDIVIIQDADLEYDPNEYGKLIWPIITGKADVVYGTRFGGSNSHRVLYFWHSVGNNLLTLLSNMFTNINLTDMETCYKAFKREIIQNINIEEDRFGFEPEITAKISKLNCSIYEVGISYYGRTYAQGKKINWKDGIRAIYAIIKYNLFRN